MQYFITSREFTFDVFDVLVRPDDVLAEHDGDESVAHGLGLQLDHVEVQPRHVLLLTAVRSGVHLMFELLNSWSS